MILLPLLVPALLLHGGPAPKLKIHDIKVGKGAVARSGESVTVDYTGTLTNGKKFDSSVGRAPFVFHLGAGEVIKGWDQGVVGMRAGGTRKLTIPSSLAYGDRGFPPDIPPKATLIFVIKLIKVTPMPGKMPGHM
jgi:FKBP-type peptidyl-prolyl cis-trans isomerase